MKVFVYFNLHKRCWSIKALEGPKKGLVISHAKTVHLSDCTFKVSQSGRSRVLSEKRKNVHAGVQGVLVSIQENPYLGKSLSHNATYNPYKYDSFVDKDNEVPVHQSETVYLDCISKVNVRYKNK